MMEIKCEQDVLSKLRPPLSLKVMREYFAELSTFEMITSFEDSEGPRSIRDQGVRIHKVPRVER